MWYGGRSASPIPEEKVLEELRRTQLSERRDEEIIYNPADFSAALQGVADAWRAATPHLEDAARLFEKAQDVAGDSPVGFQFWWKGAASPPSRREHLRRQKLYVESFSVAGREIGLQFELYALWERLGRDESAYRAQAASLLRENAEACRVASRVFGALGKPKDWGALYAAKAKRME